jgi:hypothetical protein
MGPEQYASFYEKRTEMARKNELQPGALAKQELELMQLGTNMGVDPKTTQNMLASYRNAGVSQDTARNLFAIEAQNPTGRIYDPEEAIRSIQGVAYRVQQAGRRRYCWSGKLPKNGRIRKNTRRFGRRCVDHFIHEDARSWLYCSRF